jgi:hypothetical protein
MVKKISKIELTEDDFVLVGMNYNYFMIPRLAYPKNHLKELKLQILKDQNMVKELRKIWKDDVNSEFSNEVTEIMEKYLGKR